ncbi:hypothetical protein Tco_1221423, partial [Tanacetum coccineum]
IWLYYVLGNSCVVNQYLCNNNKEQVKASVTCPGDPYSAATQFGGVTEDTRSRRSTKEDELGLCDIFVVLQGATPICKGSCRLTSLERQEVWNDCRSFKVRVGSNGNLWWETSVLLCRKKGYVIDTLKFTAMPFRLTNAPAVFMELMRGVRVARKDDRGITEGREDVREVFQQRRSGAKRKLSRRRRSEAKNEFELDLRHSDLGGDYHSSMDVLHLKHSMERNVGYRFMGRNWRELWVVEGLTLERCSTFGKKDKLEPSYVGPFEILGWIGPIVRLRISVLWAEYRKLDWEVLKV